MLFNFQPGQTWWPYQERAPMLSVSGFVRWVFRCLKERSKEENQCGLRAGLGGWGLLSSGTSMVKEAVPPCAWKTEGGATLSHTWAVHVRVPFFLGATFLLPHYPFLSGSKRKLVFLGSLILWLVGTSFQVPTLDPGTLIPSMDCKQMLRRWRPCLGHCYSPSLRSQETHTTYWIRVGAHNRMQWQLPREEVEDLFCILTFPLQIHQSLRNTIGTSLWGFNWFWCVVQGINPIAVFTLSKWSTTEPHLQPWCFICQNPVGEIV